MAWALLGLVISFSLVAAAALLILDRVPWRWEPQDIRATEAALTRTVNFYRERQGLSPLDESGVVSAVARGHSGYMASVDRATHEGPSGETPAERFSPLALQCRENVLQFPISHTEPVDIMGLHTVRPRAVPKGPEDLGDTLFRLWAGSRDHSQTMLATNVTLIGSGVVYDKGTLYVTLNLCGPRR